ncbi:DNA oxidative demethylase AlkB [Asticcacaulis machinosus]|uniref:DNA oxidative demethylase AlkB n=1 Tax=Asticcacaulis machinosus TaxID=2984211 RepID=A0ABT5HIN8_9CAUL|nr:DNA oxidative demethylase AlkB [Asticcacaulis machinosus]MDC7676077.1 DNA oxidative demethylase AlkB [Asticcacaulis machinosus]
MTFDLFEDGRPESMGDGAVLLRAFAQAQATDLVEAIDVLAEVAPFRHLMTPGGKAMSAAMTNCGAQGWVSDRRGYRYEASDPATGKFWPAMPPTFHALAVRAAQATGYNGFDPDVCLINRYEPGAKMSLHQDRDEPDQSQPIVSVSLGLEAVFLWGGTERSSNVRKIILRHGDVFVFGGRSRLYFHGIAPLKAGDFPGVGQRRLNLTFRRVAPI